MSIDAIDIQREENRTLRRALKKRTKHFVSFISRMDKKHTSTVCSFLFSSQVINNRPTCAINHEHDWNTPIRLEHAHIHRSSRMIPVSNIKREAHRFYKRTVRTIGKQYRAYTHLQRMCVLCSLCVCVCLGSKHQPQRGAKYT